MRKFLLGFLVAGAMFLLPPVGVAVLGLFNFAAGNPPSRMEERMALLVRNRSIAVRAPEGDNPLAGQDSARLRGISIYFETCVDCHGAPGAPRASWAESMNPPSPSLDGERTQALSDGELFWIVKNGVRLTGMPAFGPTHTDDDIWSLVAFLRNLPAMPAAPPAEGD